jgi:hypothetical protein
MSPLTTLKKFLGGDRSAKRSRRNAAPDRNLSLETLEARQVMAGDVQVGLWANELVIKGDNNSNTVEVSEYAHRYYEVRGLNGTTINGRSAAYVFNPTDRVNAYMNGGNDLLVFGNKSNFRTSMESLYVDMGSGADQLGLWGASVGFSGATVVMGAEWENDADFFDMGKNVFAGPNSPHAQVWGNLNVRTGGGDDKVIFRDLCSTYGSVSLRTGGGADEVRIDSLRVNKNFFADLGSGDDAINVVGLQTRGTQTIDGGADRDSYIGSMDDIWLRRARNFELVWR